LIVTGVQTCALPISVVGFDAAGGKVKIYGEGNGKVSYIALEDVAKAVVACVDNASTSRQAIPIGGPAALSQLDAIALAEKTTGRSEERRVGKERRAR